MTGSECLVSPYTTGATLPNCGKSLTAQATAAGPKGLARTGLMTQGMVTTLEIGLSAANSCQMDAVHRLNGNGPHA